MRASRWIMTIVAVGALAPAAAGQGVITTTLQPPLGMFSDLNSNLYPLDLNGDGIPDFTFGADPGFLGLRTERANRLIVRLDPPPNVGGPVARIEDGFIVGGSLDPQLAWISSDPAGGYVSPGEIAFATLVQCLNTGCASDWPGGPATRAFIGLEFELGDGLHYGYFDILMRGDIPGAELYGWAYDTRPNTPIFAGAVPEPSALALFTVAGIAMLARRRLGASSS